MQDPIGKAFDFAQETTKQVLTLASGIIAITLTFLNGKLAAYKGSTATWLEIGWCLYLASILFGIGALMALSGNLERPNKPNEPAKPPSIYRGNIRTPASLQLLAFFLATLCVLVFGFKASGVATRAVASTTASHASYNRHQLASGLRTQSPTTQP
jgi:hypothetical protein